MTQPNPVTQFYSAFQRLDWVSMQSCYHPEATFHDPVFHTLTGAEAKAMWRMLCQNAKNFSLTFSDVTTNGPEYTCRWEARYLFSVTQRPVHNVIHARIRLKDNLIWQHVDEFDFWRWSRMALGLPGVLLGWTPYLRGKVHRMARKNLEKFIQKHPEN
jgi:hypothetical protein